MTMFPSPTGVLYISIFLDFFVYLSVNTVSVPYWGSLYFNVVKKSSLHGNLIWFPSPTGVLYISISIKCSEREIGDCFRPLLGFFIFQCMILLSIAITDLLFPSPTGVLYISIP